MSIEKMCEFVLKYNDEVICALSIMLLVVFIHACIKSYEMYK